MEVVLIEDQLFERYWGEAKRFARANCDYTFASLQHTVPRALDQVPLSHMRKHARRCFRHMLAAASATWMLTAKEMDYIVYTRYCKSAPPCSRGKPVVTLDTANFRCTIPTRRRNNGCELLTLIQMFIAVIRPL
eukprot:gene26963-32577_t